MYYGGVGGAGQVNPSKSRLWCEIYWIRCSGSLYDSHYSVLGSIPLSIGEKTWNSDEILTWLFSVRFGCLWARLCSQITISPKIGFDSKPVCRNCWVTRCKHNETFWNSIRVQTPSIPTVIVKRHGFILAQLIQSVPLSAVGQRYTKSHRLVYQSELTVLQNTTWKRGN